VSELAATQETEYVINDEFSVVDSADLITQTPTYTLEQQIDLLNKFYHRATLLKKSDKRERQLLKTVVKESIPFLLRPHAYLVFSGGFIFYKESLEKQNCKLPYNQIKARFEAKLEKE
jgi:hypothetical protein